LHNMGVAVLSYCRDNKGQILPCHSQNYQSPHVAGVSRGPTVQGCIDPRRAAPGTPGVPSDYYTDFQAAAKKYYLDKETWECPNRPGLFCYGGTPSLAEQGYTKAMLLARGYKVDDSGEDYDQWGIGFQYFGGILQWQTPYGNFKSCSPKSEESKPSWALAADSNIWAKDDRWPFYYQVNLDKVPPHIDVGLKPAGGNVLTFDGAVNWIRFERMIAIHGWDPGATNRKGFWWQADLGDYGKAIAEQGRAPLQGWDVK
jgi:hypothetical protein